MLMKPARYAKKHLITKRSRKDDALLQPSNSGVPGGNQGVMSGGAHSSGPGRRRPLLLPRLTAPTPNKKDIASANSSRGRIDLLLSVPEIKDIFKKDMQLSPTFSKLKTLVLNWWVVASEAHAIIHFFRKAPVLEKISIRLCEEREYITEIEESCRLLEENLLPSEHLKIIEISCSTGYDGRLDKLVKFVDSRSTTVQVELPASMPEDAPVSESEMILQRRDHHYGAKAAEHFRIKWSSQPPALLAIWESDPSPAHHIYHPPVFD